MKAVRVLLVNLSNPERNPTIGFPLNVESLAGDLRGEYEAGVYVEVFDFQQEPRVRILLDHVAHFMPDILGVSVKTDEHRHARSILNHLYSQHFTSNSLPKFVILGGFRPRVWPEEFLSDYPRVIVCQGEGEPTMRAIVQLVRNGNMSLRDVPNLVFTKDGGMVTTPMQCLDLNEYHPPGMDTIPFILSKDGVVYWESSRGCSWGRCSFCNRRFSKAAVHRTIPAHLFLNGFEQLYHCGVDHVYVVDDEFITDDLERLISIADGIIKRQIQMTFWIQTRVNSIYNIQDSEETAQRRLQALRCLKKAGLQRIFLGLESASESQLARYRKGTDVRSMQEAIRILRDMQIQLEVGFIPIDPMTSLAELKETVDFIETNNLDDCIVKVLNTMCVQEGISSFRVIRDAGLICGDKDVETLLYPYRIQDSSVDEIASAIKEWQADKAAKFVYALRRVVDARRYAIAEEKLLQSLRKLDFRLLKGLVQFHCDQNTRSHSRHARIKEFIYTLGAQRDSMIHDFIELITNQDMQDKTCCLVKAYDS